MSYTPPVSDAGTIPYTTTFTEHGAKIRTWAGTAAFPLSVAWPSANRAILIPFRLSGPTTFLEMFFQAGTSPGTTNYDLGLYTDTFTRIVSLGATAAVNTTDAQLPVGGGAFATPITLQQGRYYLAMSSASTALTVRACVNANDIYRAFGLQMMAAAHPLPATITPVSIGTMAYLPLIGVTTQTNVL